MVKKYSDKHEILYYECDTTETLTLPMLLNIVINTSGAQSDLLNQGTDLVSERGLGWIILHYDISIHRMPVKGEVITCTTAAHSYNSFFCYRNFWVHDASGKECIEMMATFALINLETRKVARIQEDIIKPYECDKVKAIRRNAPILPVTNPKVSEYKVRFLDIDGNRHVNNSKYFEWMLDVLGSDFLTEHRPKNIQISFEKEVEYGNVINSEWNVEYGEKTTSFHRIQVGDTISAEANIVWERA